ncbi:hypothetical protein H5410_034523 [Solanum commersonii]|uniref:GTP-binding nuclear protein n=1 Tax=Solanum commersonii TaxID=4109 RepID=A0A9J5YRM2_SOLCO|nr:hypothetical protein H5410_034523 [Solanum commersonii]
MDLSNQQIVDCPSFKLVIVGDGGTGKTTFLKRHLNGEFDRKYEPTICVEVHPLDFFTNHGKIRFNCWDTVGQENIGGVRDSYYIHGQCAIIMFDFTVRLSYMNVPTWHRFAETKLISNTNRLRRRRLTSTGGRKIGPRKLVGDDNLHFVESPALALPEVIFDLDAEKWREKEFLNCIGKLPLPDENDDLADDLRGFDE